MVQLGERARRCESIEDHREGGQSMVGGTSGDSPRVEEMNRAGG